MIKKITKYVALVPAYNAENTISDVISQLLSLDTPPETIIIIDDGSQDKTAQICEEYNVRLIRNAENRGKGYVLQVGFRAFLENSTPEYLLCLDADLQHPVSFVPNFIKIAEEKNSKFVLGVRRNRLKSMPGHRVLSNLITSYIISGLCGQKIQDSQCGFRLIHRDVLEKIKLNENGYQLESEMLLKSAKEDFIIDSVWIPTIYNNEKSYIGHFSDTFRFVRLIFRELKDRMGWSTKNK